MQIFRPSGWMSSPKLPAEKHPQMHPWACLNTGRASSGHVGATGLAFPSCPPSSLSCVQSTHYLNSLYLGTFFSFWRTTQSLLCHFNLILMTTQLLVFISPQEEGLYYQCHQRHSMYVWLGYFISVSVFNSRRGHLKNSWFILNIVSCMTFFLWWRFLYIMPPCCEALTLTCFLPFVQMSVCTVCVCARVCLSVSPLLCLLLSIEC